MKAIRPLGRKQGSKSFQVPSVSLHKMRPGVGQDGLRSRLGRKLQDFDEVDISFGSVSRTALLKIIRVKKKRVRFPYAPGVILGGAGLGPHFRLFV